MASGTLPAIEEAEEAGARRFLRGDQDDADLTDQLIASIQTTPRYWWPLFIPCSAAALLLVVLIVYTVVAGIGVWGVNVPVAWAFAITNFVWWIGIGHAGTFISAFLLLLHQEWRASINRVAETMTLFAVVNAGIFPLLHLGRPWFFFWLVPYPSSMQLWPQFRSALVWDAAAVFTYLTVSILFWYVGLVPDLATLRDRLPDLKRRRIYGLFALGWKGSGRDWMIFHRGYVLLAALAAPLVVSVHSIVSLDFATGVVPGWHSTIFPPYFVLGALYSGFAVVLLLLIPLRRAYALENVVTDTHLDILGRILLANGWLMIYCYAIEIFAGWLTGTVVERYTYLVARPLGPYSLLFWAMLVFNLVTPQLFWSRRLRRSPRVLWCASLLILIGMWLERFVIIVASLNRDYLPSDWALYTPTWVEIGILAGSIGLFGTLYLLAIRWIPLIPIHEVKRLRHTLAAKEE